LNLGVNSPKILFVWLRGAQNPTAKVKMCFLYILLVFSLIFHCKLTVISEQAVKVMFFFCLLEFQKIAMATAIGFAIMGFIGFFVKLIHIPINNIIVGS
jgi:hypothetical protein